MLENVKRRKFKRFLVISKQKPERLLTSFASCLATVALYRTVIPNNLCMLCSYALHLDPVLLQKNSYSNELRIPFLTQDCNKNGIK